MFYPVNPRILIPLSPFVEKVNVFVLCEMSNCVKCLLSVIMKKDRKKTKLAKAPCTRSYMHGNMLDITMFVSMFDTV